MRDVRLLVEVETNLRLVRYSPGRIEFEPTPAAPRDLAATLAGRLQGWTGTRWAVSVTSSGGAQTIAEARDTGLRAAEAEALHNPAVLAIFAAFPAARFVAIRTPEALISEAATEALAAVDEDWDPFEDN